MDDEELKQLLDNLEQHFKNEISLSEPQRVEIYNQLSSLDKAIELLPYIFCTVSDNSVRDKIKRSSLEVLKVFKEHHLR